QLDRGGVMTSFADGGDVDAAALLAASPDLTIGRCTVRLEGMRYQVALDLPRMEGGGSRLTGALSIEARTGRSVPPLVIRGAGGWISGYVVPVMSGTLAGALQLGAESIALDGNGYHDHNWGFWEGVTWQWGQVQHGPLSIVYGRVRPPGDAADPERIPGFL